MQSGLSSGLSSGMGSGLNPTSGISWVFILAGQSNAYGNSLTTDLSAENSSYADTYPDCQHALQTGCFADSDADIVCAIESVWGDLEPRSNDGMGPALSLGRRLAEAIPDGDTCSLLLCAEGGSSLGADWRVDGGTSGRMLYAKMKRFYESKSAELSGSVKFGGVIWVQGEGDATSTGLANAYNTNLTALIAQIQIDFGPSPFSLVRLSDNQIAWTAKATVMTAQDDVAAADSNVGIFHTETFPLQVDNTHYTADSYIAMGNALAQPMLQYWGLVETGWAALTDGASLATAMRFATPPDFWVLHDEAVGATDLIGSVDLTDQPTVTHSVSDSALGTITTEFDQASNDALDAATNGLLDVGAGSFALLQVGRMTEAQTTSRSLAGKKNGSAAGYELFAFSGGLLYWWCADDAAASHLLPISFDHGTDPYSFLGISDESGTTLFQAFSNKGTTSAQTPLAGNLDNTKKFTIGQGRATAAGVRLALTAVWIGTSGEGLRDTHRNSLHTFLGLT